MIPSLSKGGGIRGTALYVLHDVRTPEDRALGADLTPELQTSHRVGICSTRNLSTDDPELAWRLMCATAKSQDALKQAAGIHKGGRPTEKFCGHLSLSWEHGAQPDGTAMLRAADGALAALGWQKLQALIVEHRDHDHAHCHVVINLIDPETGKAAPNAKGDYEKLQRWAYDYERERGRIVCPDRAAKIEAERRGPDAPAPVATARKRWLSRADYEAQRATANDRGEPGKPGAAVERAARVSRYQQAAAEVRERFRPEWAAVYKDQREQHLQLDKHQRAAQRELAGCKTATHRLDFFNRHRELMWAGIPADQRPGNIHTLLMPTRLKLSLENGQTVQRAQVEEAQAAGRKELQGRHDAARQEAQREAWKAPTGDGGQARPGEAATSAAPHSAKPAAKPKPSAPMTASHPIKAERDQRRSPEAAAGGAHQQHSRTPANESRPEPRPTPGAAMNSAPPLLRDQPQPAKSEMPSVRDSVTEHRARADAAAEQIRQARARSISRRRDLGRPRDRDPGWTESPDRHGKRRLGDDQSQAATPARRRVDWGHRAY